MASGTKSLFVAVTELLHVARAERTRATWQGQVLQVFVCQDFAVLSFANGTTARRREIPDPRSAFREAGKASEFAGHVKLHDDEAAEVVVGFDGIDNSDIVEGSAGFKCQRFILVFEGYDAALIRGERYSNPTDFAPHVPLIKNLLHAFKQPSLIASFEGAEFLYGLLHKWRNAACVCLGVRVDLQIDFHACFRRMSLAPETTTNTMAVVA